MNTPEPMSRIGGRRVFGREVHRPPRNLFPTLGGDEKNEPKIMDSSEALEILRRAEKKIEQKK